MDRHARATSLITGRFLLTNRPFSEYEQHPQPADRQCLRVKKVHDLPPKPLARAAELYQTAKLWRLLFVRLKRPMADARDLCVDCRRRVVVHDHGDRVL